VPVQILPRDLPDTVLTMISIALNLKNEQFLQMNVASLCKAVCTLSEAGIKTQEIVSNIGNIKLSLVPFYKMVYKYIFFTIVCSKLTFTGI
jgi:hypothetical protein